MQIVMYVILIVFGLLNAWTAFADGNTSGTLGWSASALCAVSAISCHIRLSWRLPLIASLTAQMEDLGENLREYKEWYGMISDSDHAKDLKIEQLESDATTNAATIDRLKGELDRITKECEQRRQTQVLQGQMLYDGDRQHETTISGLTASLTEQRGLVESLQESLKEANKESIRKHGIDIEDRDDQIEQLNADMVAIRNLTLRQAKARQHQEYQKVLAGRRVEDAWQDTPMPVVSDEPKTCLPVNVGSY